MRRSGRPALPLLIRSVLAAGLLGGCVYYNGMYNANRLANSARKAERDGRTFEASNLWGQVATKAESVIVRHPTSKYAVEAMVLRGLALARLGQCEPALGPLARASLLRGNTDLAEEALLASGRCQLILGHAAAGEASLIQLVDSRNPERRAEARYHHARAARLGGRYQEALSSLEGVRHPRADDERLLALAGIGRVSEALALADSLVAKGDTAKPWDSLLVALGRQDPASASALVDRIRRLPKRSPEAQARWLLGDGLRLEGSDSVRAAARFREAIAIGGQGEAASRASLQLVRLDLGRVDRPEALPPIAGRIDTLATHYQIHSGGLKQLGATVKSILAAAAITPGSQQGDLRLFLAGEAARDSLGARPLARMLFHRILEEWPGSPYAPKAILAEQQLDVTWTDSARALLEERYSDSPYLALIRGEATPAYRELEDSLGAFAATLARTAGDQPGGRRALPPSGDDRPNQPGRARPRPPGARVPEP